MSFADEMLIKNQQRSQHQCRLLGHHCGRVTNRHAYAGPQVHHGPANIEEEGRQNEQCRFQVRNCGDPIDRLRMDRMHREERCRHRGNSALPEKTDPRIINQSHHQRIQ